MSTSEKRHKSPHVAPTVTTSGEVSGSKKKSQLSPKTKSLQQPDLAPNTVAEEIVSNALNEEKKVKETMEMNNSDEIGGDLEARTSKMQNSKENHGSPSKKPTLPSSKKVDLPISFFC